MLISYDAYRVFLHRRPARQLHQSRQGRCCQPAQPHRTIRNLESALDCTLFVRSNRGAVLTPEGEKLFARRCRRLRTDSGGRGRAGQRPQPAKRRGLHRREAKRRCTAFFCRARRVPPRPSGDSPAHCHHSTPQAFFPPAQRWWMSPSSPPPRRTQAACTSSRSANSRGPSAARR